MAWIDDRIWCHPKVTDLSDAAFRLHVNAIAYCCGFGTRGFLSKGQLRTIGATPKLRKELVDSRLWDEYHGLVYVHDWEEHNGKRDARRVADRLRKQHERSKGQNESSPQDSPADVPADSQQDRTAVNARRRAPDDGSDGSEGSSSETNPVAVTNHDGNGNGEMDIRELLEKAAVKEMP